MSVIVFIVLFLSVACPIISARDIPTVFVVFGRPGSGKSTLVGLAQQKLEGNRSNYRSIDRSTILSIYLSIYLSVVDRFTFNL